MKHYSRRELYALGETLGESVTTNKVGGGRIYGGGGSGGGQPTQNTTVNTNIPEYAKPYVESMLGAAQKQAYTFDSEGNPTGFKPYVPYGATVDASGNITNTAQQQAESAVAGFSPMQEQAFRQTANLRVPGQFNLGTGYQALGGIGALNAGSNYMNMATNPFAQQAFMSPYMQNAVDVQKNEAIRDYEKGLGALNARAVGAGAFGGSRQAIERAEAGRNLGTQLGNIQATGTQKAFEAAQQAQQFGSNLGLQGYGQATQAGTALGNLGTQQLQAQQGIISGQAQAGSQQQQQEQAKINQAIQNYALQQQNPQLQLSLMNSLLRGLPLQQATTQQYQAAPSAVSQIGGLGTAALGAYKLFGAKEGGVVPSYKEGGEVKMAGGGISDISRNVLLNPDKYSKNTIERGQKNGLIDDYVGLALLNKKVKDAEKAKQRQAAAEAGQQGLDQTIVDQVRAKAAMLGIDNARSNLPEFSAFDGGIVAMAEGGEVDSDGVARFQAGGRSAFREDLGLFAEHAVPNIGFTKKMQDIYGYFTKPRQPVDPAAAPAVVPAKPAEPPIVIHDRNKKDKEKPPVNTDNLGGTMDGFDFSGKGIEELLAKATESLDKQATERAKDKKEAAAYRLIEAGLGMASGESPNAAVNLKGAIPGLRGYGEDMRQYRQDEMRDIGQRAALGIKGYESKADLAKLGIMAPLYKAQTNYYNRKPAGGSSLAGLGSVNPATADKIITRYEAYTAKPTDAPFFSQLPKDVQTGLTKYKPGTESYGRALQEFKRYSDQHMNQYLNTLRTLSARSRPESEE